MKAVAVLLFTVGLVSAQVQGAAPVVQGTSVVSGGSVQDQTQSSDPIGKLIGGAFFSPEELLAMGIDPNSIPSQFDVNAQQLAALGIDPNSGFGIAGLSSFDGLDASGLDLSGLSGNVDLSCELELLLELLGVGGSLNLADLVQLNELEQIEMILMLDQLLQLFSIGIINSNDILSLLEQSALASQLQSVGLFNVAVVVRSVNEKIKREGIDITKAKKRGHGRRQSAIGGCSNIANPNASIAPGAVATVDPNASASAAATAGSGAQIISAPPAAATATAATVAAAVATDPAAAAAPVAPAAAAVVPPAAAAAAPVAVAPQPLVGTAVDPSLVGAPAPGAGVLSAPANDDEPLSSFTR